jgi:N-acetylmuramoyl-L-alanine amidase
MRVTPLAGVLLALAGAAAAHEPAEQSVECVAEAVYYEARGESDESQAAVAHVVVNRAEHEEFPDTPCEVVDDSCEFSYRCDGRPEAMADEGDRKEAFRIAEEVVEGDRPDPTGGALWFHARSVQVDWFETRARTGAIGGHIFYR